MSSYNPLHQIARGSFDSAAMFVMFNSIIVFN